MTISTRSIHFYHFMPCLLFSPLILTSSEFQIFGNCDKYMEYRPWQFREPRNKTPLPTIMNSRNNPCKIFQLCVLHSLGSGPASVGSLVLLGQFPLRLPAGPPPSAVCESSGCSLHRTGRSYVWRYSGRPAVWRSADSYGGDS